MNKQVITILIALFSLLSCNSSNEFKDVFNNHIISEFKLETGQYPGVQKIAETSHFDTTLIFKYKNLLFFEMFDPMVRYVTLLNSTGSVAEYGISELKYTSLKYAYDKDGNLTDISGTLPYPINIKIEYNDKQEITGVFNEEGESYIFRYSDHGNSVFCYNPDQIESENIVNPDKEHAIKIFKLQKFEELKPIVEVIDAKSSKTLEIYRYDGLKLMSKELVNQVLMDYGYDEFNNIKLIQIKDINEDVRTIRFDYNYDKKNNWFKRIIYLDSIQILETERTITYKNEQ